MKSEGLKPPAVLLATSSNWQEPSRLTAPSLSEMAHRASNCFNSTPSNVEARTSNRRAWCTSSRPCRPSRSSISSECCATLFPPGSSSSLEPRCRSCTRTRFGVSFSGALIERPVSPLSSAGYGEHEAPCAISAPGPISLKCFFVDSPLAED